MAETEGKAVTPATVPIPGVNVPDPTAGSEAEGKAPAEVDPVAKAQEMSDTPDKAAEDGLA